MPVLVHSQVTDLLEIVGQQLLIQRRFSSTDNQERIVVCLCLTFSSAAIFFARTKMVTSRVTVFIMVSKTYVIAFANIVCHRGAKPTWVHTIPSPKTLFRHHCLVRDQREPCLLNSFPVSDRCLLGGEAEIEEDWNERTANRFFS